MTNEEFNALFARLLVGLPVTLVMNRLSLALWAVVKAGGEPAAQTFRHYVRQETGDQDPEEEG